MVTLGHFLLQSHVRRTSAFQCIGRIGRLEWRCHFHSRSEKNRNRDRSSGGIGEDYQIHASQMRRLGMETELSAVKMEW